MAVSGYSIQDLRNEVYNGGGPTDLAHYGQIWFGRSNCSLGEFFGRSWTYQQNISVPNSVLVGGSYSIPNRGTLVLNFIQSYGSGFVIRYGNYGAGALVTRIFAPNWGWIVPSSFTPVGSDLIIDINTGLNHDGTYIFEWGKT